VPPTAVAPQQRASSRGDTTAVKKKKPGKDSARDLGVCVSDDCGGRGKSE